MSKRDRGSETDPKDWIFNPMRLVRLARTAEGLAALHREKQKAVPVPGWWTIFRQHHLDWDDEREWHEEMSKQFAHVQFYFEHCSNSRSQVDYLGGDIAWACEARYIRWFKKIADCAAQPLRNIEEEGVLPRCRDIKIE